MVFAELQHTNKIMASCLHPEVASAVVFLIKLQRRHNYRIVEIVVIKALDNGIDRVEKMCVFSILGRCRCCYNSLVLGAAEEDDAQQNEDDMEWSFYHGAKIRKKNEREEKNNISIFNIYLYFYYFCTRIR